MDEEQERLAFIILAGLSSKAKNGSDTAQRWCRQTNPNDRSGHGFNKLGANRLWLDVFDDNVRARRAYETVGFRKEKTPEAIALKSDGQSGSLIIMSIVAAKYREMIHCK